MTFDGTGISVFDLKRDIILANNMGKANDFDLYIYDATSKQGTLRSAPPAGLFFMSHWHSQSTKMTPRSSPALHL